MWAGVERRLTDSVSLFEVTWLMYQDSLMTSSVTLITRRSPPPWSAPSGLALKHRNEHNRLSAHLRLTPMRGAGDGVNNGPDQGPPDAIERRRQAGDAPLESGNWRSAAVSSAVGACVTAIFTPVVQGAPFLLMAVVGLVIFALGMRLIRRRVSRSRLGRVHAGGPTGGSRAPARSSGHQRRWFGLRRWFRHRWLRLRRWFRPRWFLLGAVTLAAIILWQSTHSPEPEGVIVNPPPGPVESSEPAVGTVRGVADGQCVWLLVQEPNLGYYLQDGPVACGNGRWSGSAYFGVGAGQKFTLHLVLTGASATRAFRDYFVSVADTVQPFATSELPADKRFLYSVSVYRRR